MMRRLLITIVSAVLALQCVGCDGEASEREATTPHSAVTIGYSAPEWSGGQYLIMEGFRKRAKERGWEVVVTNADYSSQRQQSQLDYLVQQKVDAIVAVPVDSGGIVQSIAKAREAGIPFYTIDRAPSEGAVSMIVQADNYRAGQQAGEALISLLKNRYGEARGTVLELQGDLDQNVTQERGGGFQAVVSQFPAIKVIQRETKWQAQQFFFHTVDVIKTQTVDAIYMHSDMIGIPEVLPALKSLDALHPLGHPGHVLLLGVDGGPPALEAIRDGHATFVASQPLTDFGIVVDWINGGLQGKPVRYGVVEQKDALWSPAKLVESPNGPLLQLGTTPVTIRNVDDPRLWGNEYETAARQAQEQKQ